MPFVVAALERKEDDPERLERIRSITRRLSRNRGQAPLVQSQQDDESRGRSIK